MQPCPSPPLSLAHVWGSHWGSLALNLCKQLCLICAQIDSHKLAHCLRGPVGKKCARGSASAVGVTAGCQRAGLQPSSVQVPNPAAVPGAVGARAVAAHHAQVRAASSCGCRCNSTLRFRLTCQEHRQAPLNCAAQSATASAAKQGLQNCTAVLEARTSSVPLQTTRALVLKRTQLVS